MKPQTQPSKPSHQDLFRIELDRIINEAHSLVKLSAQMDWQSLDEHLVTCFCEEGLPAINTRLMVSLHYLKYANNLSDEETLALSLGGKPLLAILRRHDLLPAQPTHPSRQHEPMENAYW